VKLLKQVYDECFGADFREILNFFLKVEDGFIPSIREDDMAKRIALASLLPLI
jgi:hypothetical protein